MGHSFDEQTDSTAFVWDPIALEWVRMTQPIIEMGDVFVSGAVSVSNMIPAVETGLAKDTTLGTTNASLASIDGKVTACNTGAVVVTTMPTTTVQATDLDIHDLTFVRDKVDASGSSVTIATPTAFSVDASGVLEASSVSKASAGTFYKISGRIDSTATSGTYYIQILNHASLPGDGAVTHLMAPVKINASAGEDTYFNVDAIGDDKYGGISASTGITWCLSTTEFTKTLSSAWVSATVLYV